MRAPIVSILATIIVCSHPLLAGQQRVFESNDELTLGKNSNRTASLRIADIDRDGNLDVVVANGRHWPEQNVLLMNQGQATFSAPRNLGNQPDPSYATELADLDGDGDLDIAVGNDRKANRIFLNDGTGQFDDGSEFGEISSVRSLTLADLNGDQHVDILATCRGQQNVFYLNDGTGGFGEALPFGNQDDSTIDVAVADVNRDGHPDLVLANRDQQQNYVLLNDGQTRFTEQVPFGTGTDETRAILVADLNADGHPDLVAGNIAQPNAIYLGDGNGGFGDGINFGRDDGRTYSLDIADLDNDGDPDLVTGNLVQQNAVFFNQRDEIGLSFLEVRFGDKSGATYGLDIGDLNGDGMEDIAVANSGSQNRVFLNLPGE